MSATITIAQLREHASKASCYIPINGKVYDVTKFLKFHPGGAQLIINAAREAADAGDPSIATRAFFALHKSDVLDRYAHFVVGTIEDPNAEELVKWSELSPVPFAEAEFLQGVPSRYYNESHKRFLLAVRAFVDTELRPIAVRYDDAGKIPPPGLFKKMGAFGLLAARLGPGPWLSMLPFELPGGVKPEEYDHFHEMIATEELVRLGTPGFIDGIGTGAVIGLPAVVVFGARALAMKVATEVLSGEKTICLAISEPQAGSDVADLRTTAVKSPCGKFFVVNGLKKWITNGSFADYFVTAARRDSAEHFFRSNVLHYTATARILIPAECSAVS